METLTAEVAKQVGFKDGTKGVVVMRVDPESDAAAVGVQRGMVITHVGDQAVTTATEFAEAVASPKAKSGVRLKMITPQGGKLFLFVTPGK